MDAPTLKAGQQDKSGGRRELTKQQNRQTILEAARQVFAELGFGAATVRDIIRATPLASGTFYNYFKSKEEVYQAIRDDVALAIRPRLHEERARAATVEEFISVSFRTFFEFVATNRTDFRHMRPDKTVDTTRFRMDTPEVIAGFEELRSDLEQAIDRGLMPRVDADFLMAAIVGVAFEVCERMLARQSAGDPGAEGAGVDGPGADAIDAGVTAACDFATGLFLGGIRSLPVKS